MRLPRTSNTKRKGFTLIEILVVVAIIAVLATVVIINLDKAQARSRDARREADMDSLAKLTKLYFMDKKSLPANVNTGSTCVIGDSYGSNVCLGEIKDNGYIDKFPKDPKAPTQNYSYANYAPDAYSVFHASFFVKMEPQRNGPFPYGWNCSSDKGWWSEMACGNIPAGADYNACKAALTAVPQQPYTPPAGISLIAPGENKYYCTGFVTK